MTLFAVVRTVGACVVCAAVGFLAGRSTDDGPRDADAIAPRPGAEAPVPKEERAAAGEPRAPRARARAGGVTEPPVEPATGAGGVTVELPAPADAAELQSRLVAVTGGIVDPARGADAVARSRSSRRQAIAAAAASDQNAVRTVADEIAKERAFLADQARGGTMQMLRGLASGTRLFGLVGSADAFGAQFARHEIGPVVEGPSWNASSGLADGTTLRFPAGAHALVTRELRRMKAFPRDVTIEGAGMDVTLVRLDELAVDADVTNLTFRDCTVDCGDNYLTDLRSESPITLRLERCRVVGFDMDAGGSVMLAARRAAFYASDCRFEAGYGRTAPGFGNLFRVGDGLLVRCERCTFVGPFRSVFQADDQATYVFSRCTFEQMESEFATTLDSPADGVRFENCTLANPLAMGRRPERRPLSEINPAWPARR